jgi:hypothetical protein
MSMNGTSELHFNYHHKRFIMYCQYDNTMGYFVISGLWSNDHQCWLPPIAGYYRSAWDAEKAAHKSIDVWMKAQ